MTSNDVSIGDPVKKRSVNICYRQPVVRIVAFLTVCLLISSVYAQNRTSVSFDEIAAVANGYPLSEVESLSIPDGIALAYRHYAANGDARGVVIVYHGAGLHSGAGYQIIASILASRFGFHVITPDLRGHGLSGGQRGGTTSPDRLYGDVDRIMEFTVDRWPDLPLFFVGHSSSAGLLVNHRSFTTRASDIDGYAFLAPLFDLRSGIGRDPDLPPFSRVNSSLFVLNRLTFGLLGGFGYALFFNFPESLLAGDPWIIPRMTVHMVNAISTKRPSRRLPKIGSVSMAWIGTEDELIDSERIGEYLKSNGSGVQTTQLEGATHAGILIDAAAPLGHWLTQQISD